MIQQTKLNTLTQTLDEVLTKQNCQEENCNYMKTSIKRKFIDMLTSDNINWIFFQNGFKLQILIMATMFIIEKSIAIIVTISDLINTFCNDQIHKTTCTGLLLMFIRVIIITANPICMKTTNERQMILDMQDEISTLKSKVRRITDKKKRRNENPILNYIIIPIPNT